MAIQCRVVCIRRTQPGWAIAGAVAGIEIQRPMQRATEPASSFCNREATILESGQIQPPATGVANMVERLKAGMLRL